MDPAVLDTSRRRQLVLLPFSSPDPPGIWSRPPFLRSRMTWKIAISYYRRKATGPVGLFFSSDDFSFHHSINSSSYSRVTPKSHLSLPCSLVPSLHQGRYLSAPSLPPRVHEVSDRVNARWAHVETEPPRFSPFLRSWVPVWTVYDGDFER